MILIASIYRSNWGKAQTSQPHLCAFTVSAQNAIHNLPHPYYVHITGSSFSPGGIVCSSHNASLYSINRLGTHLILYLIASFLHLCFSFICSCINERLSTMLFGRGFTLEKSFLCHFWFVKKRLLCIMDTQGCRVSDFEGGKKKKTKTNIQ